MLCLVRYLFVISTSVIDCLGRFVPKMTYYVSIGMLNLTKLKLIHNIYIFVSVGTQDYSYIALYCMIIMIW